MHLTSEDFRQKGQLLRYDLPFQRSPWQEPPGRWAGWDPSAPPSLRWRRAPVLLHVVVAPGWWRCARWDLEEVGQLWWTGSLPWAWKCQHFLGVALTRCPRTQKMKRYFCFISSVRSSSLHPGLLHIQATFSDLHFSSFLYTSLHFSEFHCISLHF